MSTITEILGTDNITDSRAVINTNFSNLNTDKLEASDIANFETTTQLNARDTANRNRANHTGTQTASTISDFDTEVSNNTDVSANTSARHTHSNKTILDNTTASFTTAQETKLSNTSGINTGDNATNTQYSGLATSKQDTLVSGTNIKTVNSQSLLGSGDITITGTGHTIQDEGTPLTTRANLNFVGAGVTVTDDAGNNATKVTITSGGGNVTTSDTLTNNTVLLGNGTTDIKTSAKTIVTTLGTDDTTLPTSKAVKDVTDAKANLSGATFTGSISATNLSGTNSGNETATSIGTLIGLSGDATPNDTDFIATSLTDGGILKKLTWTNAKAFLKTYFDTLYAPIGIVGDMVLSSIQSVTGLKIFDKEKLAMKGTSTGVTTFSTANTSANNYIQSFQSKTGTVANMSDTMYIGTTGVTLNRASNPLTLAGITLTTPDIGTPSAGVLTNCTGLPVGGITQNTGKLLGRNTAGSGATEEITLGTGLSFSGTTLNAEVSASSTNTLTNKRITNRITTITSSATPTINTDNCDCVTITALAEAITSMTTNLSGTPTNFQKLIIRIKDNGTARAITWGTSFEAKGVALPTTTVISKVLTVGFIYDTVTSKWGCVASAQEA